MKLILTVEVEGTYDQCEEILDQLDDIVDEQAILVLGYGSHARLTSYEEVPE